MHVQIDFDGWAPLKKGVKTDITITPAVIKLEEPGALYAHTGSKSVLVGYGTYFKVTGPAAQVSSPVPGVINKQTSTPRKYEGQPFTVVDREHKESAALKEVTLALRKLRLEQKAFNEARKKADREFHNARKNQGLQQEAPELQEGDQGYVAPPPPPPAESEPEQTS